MVGQIRHRNEEEIVADILSIILDGARKTRIMYGANLSYALTTKYLNKLIDCGLIKYIMEDKKFALTSAGRHYLKEFAEYKGIEERLMSNTSLFEEKRGLLNQMLDASDTKGRPLCGLSSES